MKKYLLAVLMALLMFSVQISFVGCEDNTDDSDPAITGSAEQFVASNEYMVNARVVSFGGLSTCADVKITKDGVDIEDALVLVNSDTIPFDFGVYQGSLTTSSDYELSITHNGSLIATSGKISLPEEEPEITNLDSGDVHQSGTDLLVEWSTVSGTTSWQVTNTVSGGQLTYQSVLLPSNADSHTIPGENFSSGENEIQVNAINGLYPGDDAALSDPQVGYEIEGPKGYFIGLAQSEAVEIIVN